MGTQSICVEYHRNSSWIEDATLELPPIATVKEVWEAYQKLEPKAPTSVYLCALGNQPKSGPSQPLYEVYWDDVLGGILTHPNIPLIIETPVLIFYNGYCEELPRLDPLFPQEGSWCVVL